MRSANRITTNQLLTRTGECTFDDFCALINDYQKGDLIEGVMYVASPENTEANELLMWFGGLMFDYVGFKQLGKVFSSRVAFRLSKLNGPEPDLGFVKKARLRRVRKGFVLGPPDLAVEIVSPESTQRDYETKRKLYEKFRVAEYWIIDEDVKQVTLLRLDAQGKYREVPSRNGVLRSRVIKGFWVRVEWLWAESRPNKQEALAQLLSES